MGVVAGVSGGADSVCLLLILKELSQELNLKLYAVHIEHGIRGDESRADMEFVKALCERYSMDYNECLRWYDGYRLTNEISVFNPKAVVAAMMEGEYANHWSNTGSFENIKDYIEIDFDGIRKDVETMLGGGRVAVNVLGFLNTKKCFKDKHDVFTYLIHLGYLTYDKDAKECYIPNYEVRAQWVLAIKNNPNYEYILRMINGSKKLLEETMKGNSDYVANTLKEAHSRETCKRRRHVEAPSPPEFPGQQQRADSERQHGAEAVDEDLQHR